MIEDALPDIPRVYTALAEWGACLVYVLLLRRRLSRSHTALALAGGLGLLIGLQHLASSLPIELWTVGMILAVAAMFALIRGCAAVTAREAGYLTARAFVLAELVASLQWQLHTHFLDAELAVGGISPPWSIPLFVGVYVVCFAAAAVVERRHLPQGRPLDVDRRGVLSAVAIAGVTFLMSNLSFVSHATPFSADAPGTEIFYIRTLVDLCGYIALYAQQGQRLEVQRTAEVAAMDRMLRTQHSQYLASRRSIEEINRKYHDLKHWTTALRTEIDPARKADYLDQLEESIRAYGSRVETGNTVLDTILTAKATECAQQHITLTPVVDGGVVDFIDAVSLSALVGNALDNAVEASLRIEAVEQRLIRVLVRGHDGFVVMRFENYFEGELAFHDGLPGTSKDDTLHHGYGLRSMRQIAESYGGSLTVHAADGWFTVRILIPQPSALAPAAPTLS